MTRTSARPVAATPAGDLAVLGVDNVLIEVGDLDAAVAHYRDGLGRPLKFRLDIPGMALLALGRESPGLLARVAQPPAPTAAGGMWVWLEVPDVRAAAEALRSRGLAGLGKPFETPTGWTVEVADRWGNVLGLADYALRPEMGRRLPEART